MDQTYAKSCKQATARVAAKRRGQGIKPWIATTLFNGRLNARARRAMDQANGSNLVQFSSRFSKVEA
jgi:hypothetical protein